MAQAIVTVDAFTDRPFAGNPAAVCVLERPAAESWMQDVAREMQIELDPQFVMQIDSNDSTPNLGYPYGKQLLATKRPFTALFAYNDISAIGAIRAFQEAGLHVPIDVSVVGFDDIPGAAFHYPSLTTIRQPLQKMGEIAVEILIGRIEGERDWQREVAVQPEIVVRESTARAKT